MRDISIDVGSGITKVRASDVRANFPSLSGVPEAAGFELEKAAGAHVEFGDCNFVVGTMAKLEVHPDNLANTRDDRWFSTDAYRALLYAAMAKALPDDYSGKVALCTGLPQATYRENKDELVKRLAQKHRFAVNGKRYSVHIRVPDIQVMPQVMGLFLSRLEQNKSLQAQRVGLIDVGTYTTDWTIVDDCSTTQWASGGMPVGVANVIKEISDYCRRDLGVTYTDEALTAAIRSKKLLVGQTTIDLKQRIDQAVLKCGRRMVDAINKQWRGAKDSVVIVGGGGGELFAPQIGITFPHAQLIDDKEPIYSVVDGYFTYQSQRRQQIAA